jgi:MFS family permease
MPSTEGLVLQLLPKSGLGGHWPDDAVQSFSIEAKNRDPSMNARPDTEHSRRPFLPEPAPARVLTQLAAYPWLVVSVACLGAFAGQVDASIVQLGLPKLEAAFDRPLNEVSWVAVAYSLSFAATLPVYARLAEIAGRKLMYVLGFALFGLFSALCGLASGLPWLIAFRVLQGVSGALLGANSVVILVAAAGPARRARAMGLFAAAQAIGVSAGPVLGGMLLNSLSWHWIFWVTVPFAALGAMIGWLVVPVSTRLSGETSLDWVGALLLVPALTALMLAISKLNAWGALSFGVLGCTVMALLLATAFIRQERRTRVPLIHPGLFRSRMFSGGTAAVLLSYAMVYSMLFAMSFALVRGYHDAPLMAGLRLALVPVALAMSCGGDLASVVVHRNTGQHALRYGWAIGLWRRPRTLHRSQQQCDVGCCAGRPCGAGWRAVEPDAGIRHRHRRRNRICASGLATGTSHRHARKHRRRR